MEDVFSAIVEIVGDTISGIGESLSSSSDTDNSTNTTAAINAASNSVDIPSKSTVVGNSTENSMNKESLIGKEIYDDTGSNDSFYIDDVIFISEKVVLVTATAPNWTTTTFVIDLTRDFANTYACICVESDLQLQFFYMNSEL